MPHTESGTYELEASAPDKIGGMTLTVRIDFDGSSVGVVAEDDVETRQITSLEDLVRFMQDRQGSLLPESAERCGRAAALFIGLSSGPPWRMDRLSKSSDAFYFDTGSQDLNRAFGHGFGEASLCLSRAEKGEEGAAIRAAIAG